MYSKHAEGEQNNLTSRNVKKRTLCHRAPHCDGFCLVAHSIDSFQFVFTAHKFIAISVYLIRISSSNGLFEFQFNVFFRFHAQARRCLILFMRCVYIRQSIL